MDGLKISSIPNLSALNDDLNNEITTATKLTTTDYKDAISNMEADTKKLTSAKKTYNDMVEQSNNEDGTNSNQIKKYEMEYLWSQIGNHATKQGVTIKMDVVATAATTLANAEEAEKEESTDNTVKKEETTNTKKDILGKTYNLEFTVVGDYVQIADFLYAIENDVSLGFKIEEFDLETGKDKENIVKKDENGSDQVTQQDKYLSATFVCKNIPIEHLTEETEEKEEKEEIEKVVNEAIQNNETNNTSNTNTTDEENKSKNTNSNS